MQPANVPLEAVDVELPLERSPVIVMRGGNDQLDATGVRAAEARATASLLRRAVMDERWPVRDRATGEVREACWRDVAILLPTRTGLETYEEALALAGVPYRHEGSRDYFRRQEVRDLIALLRAIDDPSDRLSLIGALRSSAFGCSDEDLVVHLGSGGAWDYRVTKAEGRVRGRQRGLRAPAWSSPGPRTAEPVRAGAAGGRGEPTCGVRAHAAGRAAGGRKPPRHRGRGAGLHRGRRRGPPSVHPLPRRQHGERGRGGRRRASPRRPTTWCGCSRSTERRASSSRSSCSPTSARACRHRASRCQTRRSRQLHFRVGSGGRGRSGHYSTPGFDERWEAESAALEAERIRLLYVAATRARDHLIVPFIRGKRKPGPFLAALERHLPEEEGHEVEVDGAWLLDADQLPEAPLDERVPAPVSDEEVERALAERETWIVDHEELTPDCPSRAAVRGGVEHGARDAAAGGRGVAFRGDPAGERRPAAAGGRRAAPRHGAGDAAGRRGS